MTSGVGGIHYFRGHAYRESDWRYGLRYPVLLENATHHFDRLRFFTGQEALSVSCAAAASARTEHWARPSVSVQIQMDGGPLVDFCASWAYRALNTPLTGIWWIWGTRGGIRWDAAGTSAGAGGTSAGAGGTSAGAGGITVSTADGEQRHVPLEDRRHERLGGALGAFTEALRTGCQPAVDIEDNVRTLEIMVASIESAERGGPVTIQELRGTHL